MQYQSKTLWKLGWTNPFLFNWLLVLGSSFKLPMLPKFRHKDKVLPVSHGHNFARIRCPHQSRLGWSKPLRVKYYNSTQSLEPRCSLVSIFYMELLHDPRLQTGGRYKKKSRSCIKEPELFLATVGPVQCSWDLLRKLAIPTDLLLFLTFFTASVV